MTANVLTGTINIDAWTLYGDDFIADDVIFNNNAALILTGDDVLNGGAFEGTGHVRNYVGLAIDGALTMQDTSRLVNLREVSQNSDIVTSATTDMVTIHNGVGATWTLANGAGIAPVGASLSFTNAGNFDLAADDVSTVGGNFRSVGSLDLNGGSLTLTGTNVNVLGAVNGPGTLDFVNGLMTGATITGGADVTFTALRIKGVVTSDGDFGEAGGAVNMRHGTLDLTGSGTTLAADFSGAGAIHLSGSQTVEELSLSSRPLGALSLTNAGTVNLTGFATSGGAGVDVAMNPYNAHTVTLTNASGATWNNAPADGGPVSFTSSNAANAIFDNEGTFQNTSAVETDVSVSFVNNGTVLDANAAAYSLLNGQNNGFVFNDAISGTGTIQFADSVTTNAAVSAGQTFDFLDPASGLGTATLYVNDVQDFAATISGFDAQPQANDAVVFNTNGLTFEGYTPDSLNPTSGGSLMFTDGTHQYAVAMTGSYAANDFTASTLNNQTTITYGNNNVA